jgi:hypothetical protein
MATKTAGLRIGKHVTDRKARAAIEQNVAARIELIEREAAEYLAKQEARKEAMAAIFKPLAELMKADAAAERAIKKLRSELGKERLHWAGKMRRSPSINARPLVLGNPLDAYTKGPPYDSAYTKGNYTQAIADEKNGFIGVRGDSGSVNNAMSGSVDATAGIQFNLVPPPPGIDNLVHVFPWADYEWEYSDGAYGLASSCNTRGTIIVSVMQSGLLLATGSRQLFSDSGGWDHNDHPPPQQGTIPDGGAILGATFPGDIGAVDVHVEVRVQCDHNTGLGAALASALLQATVKGVTITRVTLTLP